MVDTTESTSTRRAASRKPHICLHQRNIGRTLSDQRDTTPRRPGGIHPDDSRLAQRWRRGRPSRPRLGATESRPTAGDLAPVSQPGRAGRDRGSVAGQDIDPSDRPRGGSASFSDRSAQPAHGWQLRPPVAPGWPLPVVAARRCPGWSPTRRCERCSTMGRHGSKQITRRVRQDHPDRLEWHVRHETAVKPSPCKPGWPAAEGATWLRTGRVARRPWHGGGPTRRATPAPLARRQAK